MPVIEFICPGCGCGGGSGGGECIICSPPDVLDLWVWTTLFSGSGITGAVYSSAGEGGALPYRVTLTRVVGTNSWRSQVLPFDVVFEMVYPAIESEEYFCSNPGGARHYCRAAINYSVNGIPSEDGTVMCPYSTDPDVGEPLDGCHGCSGDVHLRGSSNRSFGGVVIAVHYVVVAPGILRIGDCCCKDTNILTSRTFSVSITGCVNYGWSARSWLEPVHGLLNVNEVRYQFNTSEVGGIFTSQALIECKILPGQPRRYYLSYFASRNFTSEGCVVCANDVPMTLRSCVPHMLEADVTVPCGPGYTGTARILATMTE